MPAPQTATPADPGPNLAAQTAAMAREVVAEASASGEPMTDPEEGDEPEAEASEEESDDESEETEEAAEPEGAAGLDPELAALVKAKDLDALAAKLGIANPEEFFKIGATDFKAIRHEKREIKKATEKLERLEVNLREKYGDPVSARKAFQEGNLDVFFESVERWAQVPYSEVMKAWHNRVAGKPVEPLAPRAAATEKDTATEAKITEYKAKITTDLAGEKLAAYPGVVDLVFAKMKAKWNEGVRTPKKALELVAADLKAEQAQKRKILRSAGVLPKLKVAKGKRGMGHSPTKVASVTTAAIGTNATTRKMTDKELAQDVLKSLGKDPWRS